MLVAPEPAATAVLGRRHAPAPEHAQLRPFARAAQLAEELAAGWRAGRRPRAEDLLAGAPDLLAEPAAALQVVGEELQWLRAEGRAPTLDELRARFPALSEELPALFVGAPVFPAVGEDLVGCRLLAELGRGAEGRVFLACQPRLADRPLVLKLSARLGAEHLSLARLLHANVVPVYFVEEVPARNLRVLAMPYLGGTTLDRL
jgi:hypothetical protein